MFINGFSLYVCIFLNKFPSLKCFCPFTLMCTYTKPVQLLICVSSSTFSAHLYYYTLYFLLYLLIKLAKAKKPCSLSLFMWRLEECSCTLHITITFQSLNLHHLFLWCVIHSISRETISLPRKPLFSDLFKVWPWCHSSIALPSFSSRWYCRYYS